MSFAIGMQVRLRPLLSAAALLLPLILIGTAVAGDPADGVAGTDNCQGNPKGHRWRVGVVPQLPASQIAARWTPVLKELGRMTDQCFALVVAESIPAFERQLRNGDIDFAYLNPYHQLMAHRWRGFVPLVRDRNLLEGLLVVQKQSPMRRINDLRGAEVAFPAPNAFAASLLIRALLAKNNIPIVPVYVGTHSNVYRSVALSRNKAGGGVNHTLDLERPEVRQQLRVLWTTPGFPGHPFSASRNVPPAIRAKVKAAFLRLANQPQGPALLEPIQLEHPISTSQAKDYQQLDALGLERFASANAQ